MEVNASLVPLLVVQGASRAIDFYVRALEATVVTRYEHGAKRHVSHADLEAFGTSFALTEEARAWNSDAPPSLGGSPVVLQLFVDDAARVLSSLLDAGASVVFPMQEFLGERMARVRDPFGHLWLLRERLALLSTEEVQAERDALFARFAASADPPGPEVIDTLRETPPEVHLVVGPVGAGKSTFAQRLAVASRAVHLSLDEWMAKLFAPDRPKDDVMAWYRERAARSVEHVWAVANSVLESGTPTILELGLLSRDERERFYERVDEAGRRLVVHVLDAPRDIRRERVSERNRSQGPTFSMMVPLEIFELASDLWEPLDDNECARRDVRFVRDSLPGNG